MQVLFFKQALANHILELPPDAGRSELCQRLLKDHFDEISRKFEQVQSSQDKKNGINLSTKTPKFPAERARNVGGSLNDTTVSDSTIQRRCRNAVANVANSMHDNLIQENARFRNDAGLQVKVTRVAGSEACRWCAEVSGTFTGYNRDLKEVFRRHDCCSCTITYSSSKTHSRLVGESDGEGGTTNKWVESRKSWQEKPVVPDFRPVRFSKEQAKRIEAEKLRELGFVRDGNGVKWVGNGLTTGGNGGRIRIGSSHSIENASAISYAQSFEGAVRQEVRQAFNTEFETATKKFGRITTIRSVDVLRDNSSAEGNYNDNSNILSLRHADKKNALKIMAEIAQQEKAKGQWSTGHPQHAIRHEIGHAIQLEHKLNDPNWNEKLKKISEILQKAIQKEDGYSLPSLYSGYNKDEFISECIAASYSSSKKQSKTVKQVISIILGDDSNDENT